MNPKKLKQEKAMAKGTVYSRVNRGLLQVYVPVAGAVVYPGQEKDEEEEEESRGIIQALHPGYR